MNCTSIKIAIFVMISTFSSCRNGYCPKLSIEDGTVMKILDAQYDFDSIYFVDNRAVKLACQFRFNYEDEINIINIDSLYHSNETCEVENINNTRLDVYVSDNNKNKFYYKVDLSKHTLGVTEVDCYDPFP